MEIVLVIISFVLAILVGILGYLLGKKSKVELVKIDNSKLETERNNLEKEISLQKQNLDSIQNQYIEKLNYINSAEKRAENEYNQWYRIFEDRKNKKFKEFESIKSDIMMEIEEKNNELYSLQKQKAATIEALRREHEIEENPAKYNIPLQDDEVHDIEYLNQIRPKMRFPQIIGKVIWSSFIQKKMNNFLTNILGTEKVCGIYKITDQLTKEAYIGQSVDVHTRFTDHVKCGVGAIPVSSSNLLYAAMRRDGIENFSFELLESCEKEKLNEKERYYISLYQTDTCGLNITKGNS